jgi:hypothetical protein
MEEAEQVQEDDHRDRNAQQPEQNVAAHDFFSTVCMVTLKLATPW